MLEDEPAHRGALRYLADLHLRGEHFRDAGECFARAAATTPIRSEAADLLATAGDAFERDGDDVAAGAQFRRALELDPRCEKALAGLSEIARRAGDWGSLEKTVLALADGTDDPHDRALLKLAAARAALSAGALYRAKSHVDLGTKDRSARRKSAPSSMPCSRTPGTMTDRSRGRRCVPSNLRPLRRAPSLSSTPNRSSHRMPTAP